MNGLDGNVGYRDPHGPRGLNGDKDNQAVHARNEHTEAHPPQIPEKRVVTEQLFVELLSYSLRLCGLERPL